MYILDLLQRLLVYYPYSDLAEFEGGESKVTTLISAAADIENISRMDPAWNPWL